MKKLLTAVLAACFTIAFAGGAYASDDMKKDTKSSSKKDSKKDKKKKEDKK